MRVMVTGGTGFVGSHLIDHLVERGDRVTALVRSREKAARLEPLGVKLVSGDLNDMPALLESCREAEVVYHVAGLVAARSEAEFLRANKQGTANVQQAAQERGVGRMVLVSSMAAGGPGSRTRPRSAADPAEPVTQYGHSKLAAEEVMRAGDLPWTVVRPPMVYGPRDTEVLKLFKMARTGWVPVFGGGDQLLSAITGPDLARALVAAATHAAAVNRVFHACHPEVFTSAEFALTVGRQVHANPRIATIPQWLGTASLTLTGLTARLLNRATILTPDKRHEFFAEAWTGDPAALTEATGWSATQDLETGVALTAEWYRSNGWL